MNKIRICHLYPDMLNLYGDRGNVICLKRRIEQRGIECEISEVTMGKSLNPNDYDLFFIGGGQDFEQDVLLKDLKGEKEKAVRFAVNEGKTILAICGGYQMLGSYYKTHDGTQMDFIGALDFYTVGAEKRMIGNYAYKISDKITVAGFENHSGRTYLGNGVKPLGKIIHGFGNNGEDKTEGAVFNNTFCTYSHGPVLPKNPELADLLISRTLETKYGHSELIELDDEFELKAKWYVLDKYIK